MGEQQNERDVEEKELESDRHVHRQTAAKNERMGCIDVMNENG